MNQAALYSLDNGITMTSFKDGEIYRVPGWVAQAMIARGWARAANGKEVPVEEPPPPAPAPEPEPPVEPIGEPPPDVENASAKVETGSTFKMKLTTKGKRP